MSVVGASASGGGGRLAWFPQVALYRGVQGSWLPAQREGVSHACALRCDRDGVRLSLEEAAAPENVAGAWPLQLLAELSVSGSTPRSLMFSYGDAQYAISFPSLEDAASLHRAIGVALAVQEKIKHGEGTGFWLEAAGFVEEARIDVVLGAVMKRWGSEVSGHQQDIAYALDSGSAQRMVPAAQFGVFVVWFDPFTRFAQRLRTVFDSLRPFLPNTWFHGFIARDEAIRRLSGQVHGTFLVRCSSQPSKFALSYVDRENKVTHSLAEQLPTGEVEMQARTGVLRYRSLNELVANEGVNLFHACARPGVGQLDVGATSFLERAAGLEGDTNVVLQAEAQNKLTALVVAAHEGGSAVAADPDADRLRLVSEVVSPLFVIEWRSASGDPDGISIDGQPCIGDGTFGAVYRGQWRGTDVAIKVLKCQSLTDDVVEGFKKEINMLGMLAHANVVQWFGATIQKPLAIVSEFMGLGSLHSVLHKKRSGTNEYAHALPYEHKLLLLLGAARGMAYLHSQSVVHRDLKSLNLLVNEQLECKVCDFGLSRVKSQTAKMTGEIGTTAWMAPEMFEGRSLSYSDRVDVYSFGIVMWEVLTRQEPFDGMNQFAIAVQVATRGVRPKVPADAPPRFVALMTRCWAQSPDDRPDFKDVAVELEDMYNAAKA